VARLAEPGRGVRLEADPPRSSSVPRIAGIDVPDKKKIYFALQYIHGVGPKFAADILGEAKVNPEKRSSELTEQELAAINSIIDGGFVVEGALRRQVSQNIQRLKEIRSYRGERHRRGLPVRGQRTRSNARTRKGKKKTVAGKKGVKAK
jgi:small subunit ribosomal protein S13